MSTAKSGLTIINQTFTTVTKTDICSNVQTQLVAAGWTVVSGGGTTNTLYNSATTPDGLAIRCRVHDNGGACVQFSISSPDGTQICADSLTTGGSILPGFTMRIIASAYQFFLYAPNNYASSRLSVLVSCPKVLAPNTAPAYLGILVAGGASDSTSNVVGEIRTGLALLQAAATGNSQALWGPNKYDWGNSLSPNDNRGVNLNLAPLSCGSNFSTPINQYGNGNVVDCDPILSWALTPASNPPQLRAQLWDCTVIEDSFNGDFVPTNFDGHSWICVTNQNTGGNGQMRGSVFFITG
jgi:hypothetical protein